MATYGQRVGAWAIDCLIVYGLLFVVAVIVVAVYFPDASDTESGQTGLGLLLVLLVPLYSAFLHGLWHGQTIGKRAVGIAVRRVDRTEIGLGRSFLPLCAGDAGSSSRSGCSIPCGPYGKATRTLQTSSRKRS
jgi:uncharacterized RDD family membrane protein YckC